jgi:hypothetical protein
VQEEEQVDTIQVLLVFLDFHILQQHLEVLVVDKVALDLLVCLALQEILLQSHLHKDFQVGLLLQQVVLEVAVVLAPQDLVHQVLYKSAEMVEMDYQ